MVAGTVVGSEMRCAWLLPLLLVIAGCSFDSAPISLHAPPPNSDRDTPRAGASAGSGSGERDGGPAPVNMSPPVGQPVGGGAPSSDASEPPPASDAAVAPPADAGADAAADTGTTPEDASLPSDGLFVPCDTVDDCKAGLACYGAGFFGYCSQPCQESSECIDVDGVDFTCSPNEFACRVDCSADGTDGVCPQGLTCVDFTIDARCLPPGTGGTGDRQLFAPCDVANGDADCVDGLSCYRSTESLIDSPGYCTLDCTGFESLCDEMDVSPAELECEQSRCRFACSDAPCPDGMTCEEIGGDGVCHYPPG